MGTGTDQISIHADSESRAPVTLYNKIQFVINFNLKFLTADDPKFETSPETISNLHQL